MFNRCSDARRIFSIFLSIPLSLTCLTGASAEPAAKDRPNVLFIVADDLNTHLAAYGAPVKTPNIDRLASRGVVFERAYCQYPVCNASRASFLSGRRPQTTGVLDTWTPPRVKVGQVPFLPEHFKANGYYTARVGKVSHNTFEDSVKWDHSQTVPLLSPETHAHFSELWENGEKEAYKKDRIFNSILSQVVRAQLRNGPPPKRDTALFTSWAPNKLFWYMMTDHVHEREGEADSEPDHQAAVQLAGLIDEHKDKPFFIGAGFYRPHLPWVAPKKYFDLYPLDSIKLPPQVAKDWDDVPPVALSPIGILESNPQNEEQARKSIQAYYASVSYTDAQVGILLDALERNGLLDKTIVVLTGDHGYHLGEHNLWHKLSLFEESVRVPLIVSAPGKKKGVRSNRLVELVDIYPTLAELAGLAPPEGLEGTSLSPWLDNPDAPGKKAAYSEVLRAGQAGLIQILLESGRLHEPLPPGSLSKDDSPGRSVRTERYRYTQWGDNETAELYDHETDPHEFVNLIKDPSHKEVVAELKKLLEAQWKVAPADKSTAESAKASAAK